MSNTRQFGKRSDGPSGRRRAEREQIDVSVSLFSIDQSRVAHLEDISATGCRLRGHSLPAVGREVLLKVGNVELFGRIVWKGDAQRGIEFDQPLGEGELEKLKVTLASQLDQGGPR